MANSHPPVRWRSVKAWVGSALRRRFSPRCVCCGLHPGEPLCEGCATDYFPTGLARCLQCALPLPPPLANQRCGRCSLQLPAFDATFAAAAYAPPVDRMVLALKFGQRLDLGYTLGVMLARAFAADAPMHPAGDPRAGHHGEPLLVPMPLTQARRIQRGFNQALEIARNLSDHIDIPIDPHCLTRLRQQAPQEGLTLAQRQRNVRGAFAARATLPGRHALLVDDVLTTGSTADAAAAVLKTAGAARVTVLVVCRTT